MAAGHQLPPLTPLQIHDIQVSERWKTFKRAWDSYALALELDKIGEEAREVFSTFTNWNAEGNEAKIGTVLTKFGEYCQPQRNVPFEKQGRHKNSIAQKLAQTCDFQSITPDEILRDRLLFGIRDDKVQERLLRESTLTVTKTDEISRAADGTYEGSQ